MSFEDVEHAAEAAATAMLAEEFGWLGASIIMKEAEAVLQVMIDALRGLERGLG